MVRVLYNLTYYQVVAQLLSGMTAKQRDAIRTCNSNAMTGLTHAACLLLDTLKESEIFADDELFEEASTSTAPDVDGVPNFAALERDVCLIKKTN